jgi:hypothetical protein
VRLTSDCDLARGGSMRGILTIAFLLQLVTFAGGSGPTILKTPQGARQPQVAVDNTGRIHVTFGAGTKIYYASSVNGGSSFSVPVEVAELASLALGMRRGPRIGVCDESIVIAAIGSSQADGAGNIFAWQSQDRGASWQGPIRINDEAGSAREGLHGLAALANGQVYCTWLDLRDKGTKIFGSSAADGGRTWSKNQLVYASPDGSVCECCHPSVAMHGDDVYVMWRNALDGNRDMFLARSQDRGETFKAAEKLGERSWPLNACPMDGGAVAVSAEGKVITAWRRDHEVFFTDGGYFKERRLGMGMQPWVAAANHELYVVWLTRQDGSLYISTSPGERTLLAKRARFPVVASSPMGGGPVIAAWESGAEAEAVIELVRAVPQ